MRILMACFCGIMALIAPTFAIAGELQLRLRTERSVVHLGEAFALQVEVVNESDESVRFLPDFLPSKAQLKLTFSDCVGRELSAPEFAGGSSNVKKEDYILLRPGEYLGREMTFSPSPNDYFVGGLRPGRVTIEADLSLAAGDPKITWEDEIRPTETVLVSRPITLCVLGPAPDTVAARRAGLVSNDIVVVMEALAFFEIVRDISANQLLLGTLGPPDGWCNRYEYDAFAALRALRHQRREENLPYLRDCLTGRHAQLARDAIDEIGIAQAQQCECCATDVRPRH